jgi:hypothetical protein
MQQNRLAPKAGDASPLSVLASKAGPVVYYYMPLKVQERATLHPVHKQMLDGNDTDAKGDDKFVCTLANIQALSAETQAKWDKCKDHKDYKEPNKDAKRRLLGWVWEPDQKSEKKSPMPAHLPTYYRLKLEEGLRGKHAAHAGTQLAHMHHPQLAHKAHFQSLDNATDVKAGGNQQFDECMIESVEKACKSIAGCENPVCDSYYNEPDVEALCGMCTMVCTLHINTHTHTVLHTFKCKDAERAGGGGKQRVQYYE